jgi:hypothetical protein
MIPGAVYKATISEYRIQAAVFVLEITAENITF